MEYTEFSAKTVSDAITAACNQLGITNDQLDYQVVEEGSNGFLGIGAKPAIIKARAKEVEAVVEAVVETAPVEASVSAVSTASAAEVAPVVTEAPKASVSSEQSTPKASASSMDEVELKEIAKKFLNEVFSAMDMEVEISMTYDDAERDLNIDLSGAEMGVLIGKRGATLDSLQYLVSLVVNKNTEEYVRVKVDTENYRERRKETLENLAKNVAFKVKRTRRSYSFEPMNPYERRIIHSALQNDKYVTTHSEGEEPNRKVVVTLKDGDKGGYSRSRRY